MESKVEKLTVTINEWPMHKAIIIKPTIPAEKQVSSHRA
jgi:hypothetical protein